MLPIDILDHCTNKQTIRDSAVVRIQTAFYAKINEFLLAQPQSSLSLGVADNLVSLNRHEVQTLAMAARIEIGLPGGITDEEVQQLAAYLLKAFMGYFEAYTAAKFVDPSKAALAAMHQFNLMF